MRSNHFSKHCSHSDWDSSKTLFLNASTASSGDENRWPRIFSWYAGTKRSHWMPGLYGEWPINSTFWPVKKALGWADVWELALSWWPMIRLIKQIVVPLRINHPTMLKWNSRHLTRFAEETGHLLWSDFFRNSFLWIWFDTDNCCFVSGSFA